MMTLERLWAVFSPQKSQPPRTPPNPLGDHSSSFTSAISADNNAPQNTNLAIQQHHDRHRRLGDGQEQEHQPGTTDGKMEPDQGSPIRLTLEEQLEMGKDQFPGASEWATSQIKLYKVLFMRGSLPMLPGHWDVDFRGISVADVLFQTSEMFPPLIYSLSGRDFAATHALLRLVELSSRVQAVTQSGRPLKASQYIEATLNRYIQWAALDGGYKQLDYVPNIVVEEVMVKWGRDGISGYIENRVQALAKAQREFLRDDRDPDFWDEYDKIRPDEKCAARSALLDKYTINNSETTAQSSSGPTSNLNGGYFEPSMEDGETAINEDDMDERINYSASRAENTNDARPSTPILYRRHPPVVYGLFILRKQVYIMTCDSAKGEGAQTTFHGIVDYAYPDQGVWNAVTIAAMTCQARDELCERLDDFECRHGPEPDVDA